MKELLILAQLLAAPVPVISEDELIAGAARLVAEQALKRGSISCEERVALILLNRVLHERGSPERIVAWTLPAAGCDPGKVPWPR